MDPTHATPHPASRDRYAAFQAEWAACETRWSWTRLAIFVAVVAIWFLAWRQPLVPAGVTLLGIALFGYAVRKHQFARGQREQGDRLLLIQSESQRRRGGNVELIRTAARPAIDETTDSAMPHLLDEGRAWELTDQERDDLDLFAAPVGIFGLLNRTSTALGARRLAAMLDRPLLSVPAILNRQDAVRWLAENESHRDMLMAAAAALRNEDKRLAKLVQAIRQCTPPVLFAPAGLLRLWSLVSAVLILGSVGLVFVGQLKWAALGGPILAINLVLHLRMHSALRDAIDPWIDVGWAARGMRILTDIAAQELPDRGHLSELRAAFQNGSGRDGFAAIERLTGWAEHGGGMHFLFNVLAFYDLHVAAALTARAVPRKQQFVTAISAMARLEALASLACFASEQPIRCYPQFATARDIRLVGGAHPLVAAEQVVANDLDLSPQARLRIITGSNMAGKSTYLRMIGVNVLLAQIGATPTAQELQLPPLRLISDLRARDNLAQRESYYLSEVRHLKRMILPPAGDEPILGLIDEPFRGTNSEDQTAASVAVVKHLIDSGDYFLLATHDRHLTLLADGERVRNCHFQENLGRDGLVFDYKLHDGPATTRNALRILEREGYPEGLLRDARGWLARQDRSDEGRVAEPAPLSDVSRPT